MINAKKTHAMNPSNRYFITGIGSLPHGARDAAIEYAFRHNLPFLPQIPLRNANEFMLSQMLYDLPGAKISSDGAVFCESLLPDQIQAFKNKLDLCLNDPHSTEFEPKPEASSLWQPFLYELETRKLKQAKIQVIGPLTANWATQGNAESKGLITKLVFARALSMIRKLHQIGVQAIVFIDEPGLYVFDPEKIEHQATFSELKLLIQALKKESAQTGIHCCSNTHWDEILKIHSLDWLSFDADLSLDAILKHHQELIDFIENQNGKLAIGLIPTGSARLSLSLWNVKDAILRTEALLNTVLPKSFIQDPNRVLLTPACGLAYSSIHDSEVILDQLHLAQKLWGDQNQ